MTCGHVHMYTLHGDHLWTIQLRSLLRSGLFKIHGHVLANGLYREGSWSRGLMV